jgi:hypothetical protein
MWKNAGVYCQKPELWWNNHYIWCEGNILVSIVIWGTRSRSWLSHYATSRKVAGSIPDYVTEFFNSPNSSSRTLALGSTQPLTKRVPGIFLEVKVRPARQASNLTAICEPIV